jgi:SAM-dependent methyltransferase
MTISSDKICEYLTPKRLLEKFDDLCSTRSDIRVLPWMLGRCKTLEWLNSLGVCKEIEFAKLAPPLPPLGLRQIVAAPEPEIFLWTGFVDAFQMLELHYRHGGIKQPKILDFGCGCGRMTRFLPGSSGSEINPDHVQWCLQSLPEVDTRQNQTLPPLPFADASFDLVYSLSILTHLPEHLANCWLQDLHRVAKPNALVILTTHGITALETIRDSQAHQQMFKLTAEDAQSILQRFQTELFIFHQYAEAALTNAKAGAEYGNAFIHGQYISSCWDNERFHLVEHIPGGLRGWQDIVILRSQ